MNFNNTRCIFALEKGRELQGYANADNQCMRPL